MWRHCTTSWEVAGLIPDEANEIFHWFNSSGHSMALGSTWPPTEMSTRCISWGVKGSWCIGLTTLPPSCADCLEIPGASTSWSHKGLICGIPYSLTYKMGYNSSTVRQLLLAWKPLHRMVFAVQMTPANPLL